MSLRKRVAKIVGVSVLVVFAACVLLGMLLQVIEDWHKDPVAFLFAGLFFAVAIGAVLLLDWADRQP